jgi:lysylphosphatidylglycerol synthetase-like protein (DUF2156 family)
MTRQPTATPATPPTSSNPSSAADAGAAADVVVGPPIVRPGEARRARRARRIGAAGIALAALMNLISALAPRFSHRLRLVERDLPLSLSQAGHVLAAITGVMLLQLARGVRRGQRLSWLVAVLTLLASSAGHLVKGLDVVETALGLLLAAYLLISRRHFRADNDPESLRTGLLTVIGTGVLAIVVAIVAVRIRHQPLPMGKAAAGVLQRLVGIQTTAIPGRVGKILSAVLPAVGLTLAASVGWLLVRPRHRPSAAQTPSADMAWSIVRSHGADTLSYFALRDDKHHFVHRQTLVAYGVFNGVCLVSPDPVGPLPERGEAWHAMRRFVDEQGWSLAVLGAGESWLPIYDATGMDHRYIGDEAVVDVRDFSMHGGEMKGLRQAVNRVAKYGYTITFHDPATIDRTLAMALRTLMSESRKGDVERGFSMTLSRLFDQRDTGLLMAVCHAPDGAPVAFCQYVPAGDINGYSLDLMRRSTEEHPNGLTDFVIVKTIEHLRDRGFNGLSLNFAAMRAIISGENGDDIGQRLQRWFLEQMSSSMQIESLWKYNAKFQPAWRPRYAVYDAPEHIPAILVAVAKAESWWEIPVIGAWFKPDGAHEPVG